LHKNGQKPDQGLGIEVNARLKIIINPLAHEKPFGYFGAD